MIFLPIFERELRVAARRPATHRLRFFLPLLVLVIWFFLLVSGQASVSMAQRGKMLFMALSILSLAFCLIAGIFLTADCLSEEKREGTLGLLFLTELRGYDVVIGKLAATSLHAIYGLVAILPVLALPLLMGGVSLGEFWRMALALISTLFLSLSIGLVVSALNEVTRQAVAGTLLVLLVLSGLLPALYWLLQLVFNGASWEFVLWLNPPYLFSRTFDSCYQSRLGFHQFWNSCLCINILTLVGLASASHLVVCLWRRDAETQRARVSRTGKGTAAGAHSLPRPARGPLLDQNPYYWLASRDRSPARAALTFIGFLLPVWLCFLAACFANGRNARNIGFSVAMLMAFVMHQVLKFLLATEASRRFSDDYHSGTMELLLVTPLSAGQILAGQRRALKETFLRPALLLLFMNLALSWLVVGTERMSMMGEELVVFCEVLIAGGFLLLADYHAMSWAGMSLALSPRRHPRVIFETLAKVMFLPWLFLMMFVFVGMGGRGFGSGEVKVYYTFWVLGALALDVLVAARARARLIRQLRKTAVDLHLRPQLELRPSTHTTLSLGKA